MSCLMYTQYSRGCTRGRHADGPFCVKSAHFHSASPVQAVLKDSSSLGTSVPVPSSDAWRGRRDSSNMDGMYYHDWMYFPPSLPPSLRPNTPPPSYWGVRERLSAKGLVGMAICWQRLLVLRAPGSKSSSSVPVSTS